MRIFIHAIVTVLVGCSIASAQEPKWIGSWNGKAETDIAAGTINSEPEVVEVDGEEVEIESGTAISAGKISLDVSQTEAAVILTYTLNTDVSGSGKGAIVFEKRKLTLSSTKLAGASIIAVRRKASCEESLAGSLSMPDTFCWERVYDETMMDESLELPVGRARIRAEIELSVTQKGKLKGSLRMTQNDNGNPAEPQTGDVIITFDGLNKSKK